MNSAFTPFLCAAGFLLIGYPISYLFWRWIIQKGWISLRFVALCLSILIIFTGIIIWMGTQDDSILFLAAFFVIAGNFVILTIPKTNPSLMKLLRIKW